jgi:predicted nucleic acid-binding Zn ribbon protein
MVAGEPGPGRSGRNRAHDDRGAGPRPVASSLNDAVHLLGVEGAVELATVKRGWVVAVGEEVAAHCWPVSYRRGQLTVATNHPAWATELRIQSGQLLKGIRSIAPEVESVAVQISPNGGRDW